MTLNMPLATRKRSLELGAQYIENALHQMRDQARQQYEHASQREDWNGREFPLTTSLEGDLMKVAEWASAATTLRMLAEQEPGER
jgi:hypothetical protein